MGDSPVPGPSGLQAGPGPSRSPPRFLRIRLDSSSSSSSGESILNSPLFDRSFLGDLVAGSDSDRVSDAGVADLDEPPAKEGRDPTPVDLGPIVESDVVAGTSTNVPQPAMRGPVVVIPILRRQQPVPEPVVVDPDLLRPGTSEPRKCPTFECPDCGSKISIPNKSRHLKLCRGPRRSGPDAFACTRCAYTCSFKSNLIRHYKVRHNGRVPPAILNLRPAPEPRIACRCGAFVVRMAKHALVCHMAYLRLPGDKGEIEGAATHPALPPRSDHS